MEILDSEKRRARNLIWNAAGDYSFEPDFKAYDEEGRADLYWNSIIGAARKNFGEEVLSPLLNSFKGCVDIIERKAYIYEGDKEQAPTITDVPEELKEKVDNDGTTVEYNNGGGQSGVRDNPDVKTLIAYQKNNFEPEHL